MRKLGGIYTIRDTIHPYYWDVVYEWEEELSKALGIPLIPVGNQYDLIYKPSTGRKILNRFNFYQNVDKYLVEPKQYYLAFHIGPPGVYSFHTRKDVIPIIIDFWKNENLTKLESILALNKTVFVTSKEVYNYLLDKKLKINLEHLALSLPDSLITQDFTESREFDLIQVGRQNNTLSYYVKLLLAEFPGISYVYGEKIDGKIQMCSSTKGRLGEYNTRKSFLNLLRKTKISLLSAPGLDDDGVRTGGFSPVTPRFLESAACNCHLIGIYPDNEDFLYYGINEICVNVKDYESFRRQVLMCLDQKVVPNYQTFLKRHLTSKRATELKEKLFFRHEKQ